MLQKLVKINPITSLKISYLTITPSHQYTPSLYLSRQYCRCTKYLFGNWDFKVTSKKENLKIKWKRFDNLLKKLEISWNEFHVIHIAGTNGKGTASILSGALLQATGASVGIFTSPHLHTFRERIQINGEIVNKDAVIKVVDKVQPITDEMGITNVFEKLTAVALMCFKDAGVDWVILETGLGGRWDFTNHCIPTVCGITRIGMDHMNVLGQNISQIASEKAGIIKSEIPVFSVTQESDAMQVLEIESNKKNASLKTIDSLLFKNYSINSESIPPWLKPSHQQENCALAITMIESLADRGFLKQLSLVETIAAINKTYWPGRFECQNISSDVKIIFDTAHNEPSLNALIKTVGKEFVDHQKVFVFGAGNDKDYEGMLKLLPSYNMKNLVLFQSKHPKSVPLHELKSIRKDIVIENLYDATSSEHALHLAIEHINHDGVIVCCGSVFVIAEMRSAVAKLYPTIFDDDDWVHHELTEPSLI